MSLSPIRFAWALLCISSVATAADTDNWKTWAADRAQSTDPAPVVQNRVVSKAGRFQIFGPLFGFGERGDLYDHLFLSAGLRYSFTEIHAWELLRLDVDLYSSTSLVDEIQAKTSFVPDARTSHWQLSSSYIFSPIYGKYAWNETQVIYFDIFGSLGAGVRFPTGGDAQPFGVVGIGMNNWVLPPHFAVVPEIRFRGYSEQRTGSTFVLESIVQLGVSWLW